LTDLYEKNQLHDYLYKYMYNKDFLIKYVKIWMLLQQNFKYTK